MSEQEVLDYEEVQNENPDAAAVSATESTAQVGRFG